jgi:hypothetical protein
MASTPVWIWETRAAPTFPQPRRPTRTGVMGAG